MACPLCGESESFPPSAGGWHCRKRPSLVCHWLPPVLLNRGPNCSQSIHLPANPARTKPTVKYSTTPLDGHVYICYNHARRQRPCRTSGGALGRAQDQPPRMAPFVVGALDILARCDRSAAPGLWERTDSAPVSTSFSDDPPTFGRSDSLSLFGPGGAPPFVPSFPLPSQGGARGGISELRVGSTT